MNPHKLIWRIFLPLTLLILTACGTATEPPAPTLDTALVFTQAAQTVAVQLSQTAAAQPTATALPTEMPTQPAPPPTLNLEATQPAATLSAPNTPVTVLLSPTLSLLPLVPTSTETLCNNSAFVADVGTPDKTVLKPGQTFQKGWLIQNTGSCNWGPGYSLRLISGNTDFGTFTYVIRFANQIVLPGQITEISFTMVAPKTPGLYEAFYQMYSDLEVPFGTGLSASIEVRK